MARRYYKNTAKTVVTVILVLILLALAVGLCFVFINGTDNSGGDIDNILPSDSTDDYLVKVNGVKYVDGTVIGAEVKSDIELDINYDDSYSIFIIPREGKDFEFKVGGTLMHFNEINSLNLGFEVKATETGVTIKPLGDLKYVLRSVYGKDVEYTRTDVDYTNGLYTVVIKDINGNSLSEILLNVAEDFSEEISLSSKEIIF